MSRQIQFFVCLSMSGLVLSLVDLPRVTAAEIEKVVFSPVALASAQREPLADRDDRLGGGSIFGEEERLPQASEGTLVLPPIMAATIRTDTIGNGSLPKPFRDPNEVAASVLPESGVDREQDWVATRYEFAAANTFSHPRYFEDRMLERHGHERFPALQPLVSGVRFYATMPMLPYLMTVRHPCECESSLGYFRPGTCVYPYIQRPPYERKALLVESAAVAGAFIAIP